MTEYSFCIQGSHRQTTVIGEDILSAAKDAAWLLHVAEHELLLWLPPLPPLTSGNAWKNEPAPVEIEAKSENTTPFDWVSIGRACFPLFLTQAERHWHTWQESQESDQEAMARYSLMVCGAIDALFSSEALEQVRSHLLKTSGVPPELMAPTFEVALEQLESLKAIFLKPYERRAFQLFLCVLAFTCQAVPLTQTDIDRLRDCLTVVEQRCSALLETQKHRVELVYNILTQRGELYETVRISGEDEEDCQEQLDRYLSTKQDCYGQMVEGR